MKRDELLAELRYIADSPAKEHGGFDERVVAVAKEALLHLEVTEELLWRAIKAIAEGREP